MSKFAQVYGQWHCACPGYLPMMAALMCINWYLLGVLFAFSCWQIHHLLNTLLSYSVYFVYLGFTSCRALCSGITPIGAQGALGSVVGDQTVGSCMSGKVHTGLTHPCFLPPAPMHQFSFCEVLFYICPFENNNWAFFFLRSTGQKLKCFPHQCLHFLPIWAFSFPVWKRSLENADPLHIGPTVLSLSFSSMVCAFCVLWKLGRFQGLKGCFSSACF